MGDFNKDLSFTNFNREWSDFTTLLGLRQLHTQPTKVTDSSSILIDHLYSGDEENLSNVHVAELGISDHYAIFCNRKVNFSFKKNSHKSIQYRSSKHFQIDENDFLIDLFAAPLNQIETLETVKDALEDWNSIFLNFVDNHSPIR